MHCSNPFGTFLGHALLIERYSHFNNHMGFNFLWTQVNMDNKAELKSETSEGPNRGSPCMIP